MSSKHVHSFAPMHSAATTYVDEAHTTSWRVSVLIHAVALVGYALLTVVATYPLITALNDGLVSGAGKMSNDRMQNLWNLWWVRQALTQRFTNPYHTDFLMYPQGASLYLHTLDLPLGVLSIPFQPLVGIVATYNLMIMLTLVLAGYCTFLLARRVSGSTAAGFVAGVIALCAPLRLGDIRLGLMPMLTDFAVPLCVLAVLRALESRSWRWDALTAAFWVIAGLCMWYHFLNVGVALVVLAMWRFVAYWRAGKTSELRADVFSWLRIGALCALFALPFLLPAMLEATHSSYARKPDSLVWSVTLNQLLPPVPEYLNSPTSNEWTPGYLYAFGPLALALLALILVPRKASLWATLAFVCLLFSFGPSLSLSLAGATYHIPMPYAPLRYLPVIEGLRMPGRFTYIVVLFISVMAALAVTSLLSRIPSAARIPLVLLGSVLLAAETIRLPMAIVPTPISPFYQQLATTSDDVSVVEFPFDRSAHNFTEMQAQTIHGKRILTGQTSRDIPRLPYESMAMFAQIEEATEKEDIVRLSASERQQLLDALKVRYLVFRRDPFHADRMDRQIAVAQHIIGPLERVYSDAELQAFKLSSNTSGTTQLPLFLGRDDRWSEPEYHNGIVSRWIDNDGSGLWTFVQQPQQVALQLDLYSLPGDRPLEIWLNDKLVMKLPIAAGQDVRHYVSAPFTLPAGTSLLTLRAPNGGVSPASLGLGDDQRELSFSIQQASLRSLAPAP